MKASDYRQNAQARKTERPTTTLQLPSGAEFVVTRPPLEVWIAAGKIPQSFLRASMEPGGAGAGIDAEDNVAAILFLRDAVLEAVIEPRLVVGTTNPDELDPCELDPEDFQFMCGWIMRGCPGVPVATKGGQTEVESLSRFRQKRPGGKPFSLESDSETVGPEAERSARTG